MRTDLSKRFGTALGRVLSKSEFMEEEHPRDASGQFADQEGVAAAKAGLSQGEGKAVELWSHTLYREATQAEPKEDKKASLRDFQSAIDKIPEYRGTIYRAIVLDNLSDLKGGAVKQYERFKAANPLSASKSREEAEEFATSAATPNQTVLVMEIAAKTGADISEMVAEEYRDQQEVVMRPGTMYDFKKINKPVTGSHGGKIVRAKMEEVHYISRDLQDAYYKKIGYEGKKK